VPKIQDHTWLLKDQQVLISTFLARFLHGQIVRTVLKPNMQFPAKTRYVDIPGMSTEALNYDLRYIAIKVRYCCCCCCSADDSHLIAKTTQNGEQKYVAL